MAAVTPAGEVLRAEIARGGPVTFHRFMEVALYHPEHGYYRRARDPFGRGGDFFTAEQLQPVFGILVSARVRELLAGMGAPEKLQVIELGAGRREMAAAFAEWSYIPVEIDDGALPEALRGVVFSNEFFDALPVHAATLAGGVFRELRVDWREDAFRWVVREAVSPEIEAYLRSYFPDAREGGRFEVNLDALRWMERIAGSLESGYVFTIDYGYTRSEARRFPQGTLMSYRRHLATEDVLSEPGSRDLTAHVCFTALEACGQAEGLETVRFQTLAQMLLDAGEADQFAAALSAGSAEEELRRRLQLKTLLFGMGESFRVLIQRKPPK